MGKDHFHEARLVDLSDTDLKEVLGSAYQRLKNLEEQKNIDANVLKLKQELKDYIDKHFSLEIRSCKATLKAARLLANARNIEWRQFAPTLEIE